MSAAVAEANRRRAAAKSMVGELHNGIEVLAEAGRTRAQKRTWLCLCHCGKTFTAIGSNLRSGMTRSCGCVGKIKAAATGRAFLTGNPLTRTHGQAGRNVTRSYRSWAMMIQRCTNKSLHSWPRYGGRGIKVCEQWRNSFERFLKDMGERPDGKTLDRYPNPDGNYEPGNCRWATPKEQRANIGTYERKAS